MKVVFPLLWPVTATVAVLTGIVVWNEFFIALVFLSGSDDQTLPVALYAFAGDVRHALEPHLRRRRDRDRAGPRLLPLRATPPDARVLGGREGLMAAITLSGVSKVFTEGKRAVAELDLEIEDGELMVLVGPSGCGKSTTLRMIAGLEEVTVG